MGTALVDEMLVNLVCKDKKIMTACKVRNRFQLATIEHLA